MNTHKIYRNIKSCGTVCLLIMITGLFFMNSTASAAEDVNYTTSDWIGQVYQDRGDTTLRQMVIPGTHDSGTYSITSDSDLAPDGSWIYNLAKVEAQGWSKTQNYRFSDMLSMGIRHFDLRILKHEGTFVAVHGLVGAPLTEMLNDVKVFADAHPKEIIILEVAKTPDSSDMPSLLDMFDTYVGERKPDNSIPLANLTIDQMWADDANDGKNNSIVVLWASGSSWGTDRGYFAGDQLTGTWADTTSSGDLYHRLENGWVRNGRTYLGLKNAPTDKLFYSAFTYTPQTSDITNGLFNNNSIKSWVKDYQRAQVGEWLPGWIAKGYRPNILTADFFEFHALVPIAIKLNTIAPPAPEGKILAKYTHNFEWRYNDDDTGSDDDFWVGKPVAEDGYYPIGYIGGNNWYPPPSGGAILVKATAPGQLARPLGYTWVWNDKGSGGDHDIQVWEPIAPEGYTALGNVTTMNYGGAPSTDEIRCIHNSYLIDGSLQWLWDDSGSGSDYDFMAWNVVAQDANAITPTTFISSRSYNQKMGHTPVKALNAAKFDIPVYRELKVMGVCMDSDPNNMVNGSNVYVWDCWNPATWQKWIYEESTGFIRSKNNPDMCLDCTNGNSAGTSVQLWTCEDHINLKWDWVGNTIRPRKNHNLALDVKLGTPNNGQDLWLWNADGNAAQIFSWGNQ